MNPPQSWKPIRSRFVSQKRIQPSTTAPNNDGTESLEWHFLGARRRPRGKWLIIGRLNTKIRLPFLQGRSEKGVCHDHVVYGSLYLSEDGDRRHHPHERRVPSLCRYIPPGYAGQGSRAAGPHPLQQGPARRSHRRNRHGQGRLPRIRSGGPGRPGPLPLGG